MEASLPIVLKRKMAVTMTAPRLLRQQIGCMKMARTLNGYTQTPSARIIDWTKKVTMAVAPTM